MSIPSEDQLLRRSRMGLLARANPQRLAALMPDLPAHAWLRAPEIGTVMVRGRTGARGAPFNLGEMTVTRCSLRLEDGRVGHAYVQGRDRNHATRAALIDALMQGAEAARIEADLLLPLRAEEDERRTARAEKAAATRVEFFTMVRGED
ncbi:phosphonate C-P lyase system protein PhnG [Sedimentimonas flavescens]|uniref:Phosphonate C-P lyase system protein PhnG n=1 Tax=Sedimentimonas flavescens TaxID=2851012 RepID=A0ABT2ZYX6_9RHOB|nr:phosphonate C-P lyase system protein PhnG [Sedimentimonas flavescens]MCT2539685.1 phosphonate C-P lyase system protein PhnG [Sedimentimonas flavescens]MCV2878956.1 phosphonate C-P lyase system protein PhnG [Sedimentimonas flavescens]